MSVGKIIKKNLLRDFVVLLVLGVVVFIATTISQSLSLWHIKKDVLLENNHQKINKNIRISAKLELKESSITLESQYDNHLGIIVEGKGRLILKDSEIISEDYKSYIYAGAKDGYSPTIELRNSKLTNITELSLFNNSILHAEDSKLEKLFIYDKSSANLKNTSATIYLSSTKKEIYENFQKGLVENFEFVSKQGWSLKLENADIQDYYLNLGLNSDVVVNNSSGIIMNIDLPKDLQDGVLDLNTKQKDTGDFESEQMKMKWENTIFDRINVLIRQSNSFDVRNSHIGFIGLSDSSILRFFEGTLICDDCTLLDGSELLLENIVVDGEEPILKAYKGSVIRVINSDLKNLKIELSDRSILMLDESSIVNEDNITKDNSSSIESI